MGRYGLQLHPTKTHFVDFRFKHPGVRHPATAGTTSNFLGFTHVWGRSRKGVSHAGLRDLVRAVERYDAIGSNSIITVDAAGTIMLVGVAKSNLQSSQFHLS